MGKIARQTRKEFKRLPWMLGKVVGGIVTAIGSLLIASAMTRTSEIPPDLLSPLFIGGAGILVFLLSDRALQKGASSTIDASTIAERNQMNVLSWTLLLICALVFLGATCLLTR